jgi:LysR family positive regulator for ilvC
MDLRNLQVFLSIYRTQSFTRAAEEMHMSVSAVSRALSRLEQELGCVLFDRDRRNVRVTSSARELAEVAEGIVSDWHGLQHALSGGSRLSGELRIFCSVTATHHLLSPLLGGYRDACPGVEVMLQTGDQADGLERVLRGDVDVAVIALPETLPPMVSAHTLARSALLLCTPTVDCAVKRLLDEAPGEPAEVLARAPWILPERGVTRELAERWLQAQLAAEPKVYAQVAGHEAIAAMISLGLGVGILPQLVIAASGVADSLQLHPLPTLPDLEIALCVRETRLADPIVASLWQVAIASAPS